MKIVAHPFGFVNNPSQMTWWQVDGTKYRCEQSWICCVTSWGVLGLAWLHYICSMNGICLDGSLTTSRWAGFAWLSLRLLYKTGTQVNVYLTLSDEIVTYNDIYEPTDGMTLWIFFYSHCGGKESKGKKHGVSVLVAASQSYAQLPVDQ